jgi:hypothetical protein
VTERAADLRQALRLSALSIVWSGLAGSIAVYAAIVTGSLSLLGFGADAVIDSVASIVLVWRFLDETRQPHRAVRVERAAERVVGLALIALALYLAANAVRALAARAHPEASVVGLALLVASVVVLPPLAVAKYRVALRLGSGALRADSILTAVAALLAVISLASLSASQAFGFWWADAGAALAVGAIVLREGWRSLGPASYVGGLSRHLFNRRLWVLALAVNAILLVWLATWNAWSPPDWQLLARIPIVTPYEDFEVSRGVSETWRFSPVAIWLFKPLAVTVGQWGFALLHLALLALLPRRVAVVALISWPFWIDVIFGNVFTLVFISAFWAVRGNRLGVVAFAILTLLMPRPVQLPLLAWLLWRDPAFRLPFALLFVVHAALVVSSGLAGAWMARLFSAPLDMREWFNFGPTQFLGYGWLVIGLPLGAWLWSRGKPLLAGLAISPYILGQYWILVLAERPDPSLPVVLREVAEAVTRIVADGVQRARHSLLGILGRP